MSGHEPPAWVGDAVFYQIFPDRFARSERVARPGPLEDWDSPPTVNGFKGGDLLGIVEHLDHIAELGATAIYLNPVFQSASNHRYHTYDYLAVDPLLGGDLALRELLDAAHALGIRVILDGVFNHTGRGFWAFHHVLETGAGSPYRRWFVFDQAALDRGVPVDAYPNAHRRATGQRGGGRSASGGSLQALGYQAWWDLPALPKLNIAEPAVRAHLFEVAEHWLRFGADGWRLDVPAEIDDPAFWAEFRERCRTVNPEAYLVGEIWHVAPEWLNGDRFDGLMNYPLAKATIGFVAGAALDEAVLRRHHQYAEIGHLSGVDFARRLQELLATYRPSVDEAQLNLLDSHDTPRLASILGNDRDAIRLATLLQMTLPGAPSIYYGGEIGLQGGVDPDSRRAFPWDEDRWDRDLLAFVRAAIAVRRAEPLLRRGVLEVLASGDRWIAFERRWDDRPEPSLVVALNAGTTPVTVDVGGPVRTDPAPAALSLPGFAPPAIEVRDDGHLGLTLGPRSGAIIRAQAAT